MAFAFPGLIDASLVADAAFGGAYDALAPEERAVIKTAIARMVAGEAPPHDTGVHGVRTLRQGFSLHAATHPAPWALVLWDSAYAGPTRVLAALLPAMLAGVPNILACRVAGGGRVFPRPLLAALELAGQELVADCGPETAATLAARCCGDNAAGRLVLLGRETVFDQIARVAAEHGTPALRYAAPVRIGIAASSFAAPVLDDHLRLAHPDAALVPFEGDAARGQFSAIFCSAESVPAYLGAAPLALCPGNEAYWAWPGLSSGFFRETDLGISGITQERPTEELGE